MNIKTTIHTYRHDVSTIEGAAEYKALCEKLKAAGLTPMVSWGGEGHYDFARAIDGRTVALETEHLFDNQWNTAPIAGISDSGLRVFDWAEDYPINFPKNIKRGHYLAQTDDMREVRRNTHKCGYCGKQEAAAKGYTFCPHCVDSPYLTADSLQLTRMVPVVDTSKPRAPLTEAEKAHLLPIFEAAQIHGATERGKARIAKERADVEREYKKAVRIAKTEHDGKLWLMDNGVSLGNVIFYTHTERFSFGWRKPLSAGEVTRLLDVIGEFPFPYNIKCDDGRTLSGD